MNKNLILEYVEKNNFAHFDVSNSLGFLLVLNKLSSSFLLVLTRLKSAIVIIKKSRRRWEVGGRR